MHAVAPVDVEAARRAEHRSVTLGWPAMRVRGGVGAVASVGLDFDEPNDQALAIVQAMNEAASDQFLRNDD